MALRTAGWSVGRCSGQFSAAPSLGAGLCGNRHGRTHAGGGAPRRSDDARSALVADSFSFAACFGLAATVPGSFPVLDDGRFLAVLISTLAPGHIIAAQGAGGAFRGERFGVLPLLLCRRLSFRPGCRAAFVGMLAVTPWHHPAQFRTGRPAAAVGPRTQSARAPAQYLRRQLPLRRSPSWLPCSVQEGHKTSGPGLVLVAVQILPPAPCASARSGRGRPRPERRPRHDQRGPEARSRDVAPEGSRVGRLDRPEIDLVVSGAPPRSCDTSILTRGASTNRYSRRSGRSLSGNSAGTDQG